MRQNILIVFDYAPLTTLRATIRDHVNAFKKYSAHNIFYLNLAYREKIPWHVRRMKFDVVIFHTLFFTARWDETGFQRTMRKAQFLKELDAVKVGLPQDEHFKTGYIHQMIQEFGIQTIFSVGPSSEWPKLYGELANQIQLKSVLTGYLDPSTIKKINAYARKIRTRTIDIGYRARHVEPSLGRHGRLKPYIAEQFLSRAAGSKLLMDISTRAEDTIVGNAWYAFLLRCKYTIGVEGGASILDRDGSIRERTLKFMEQHPEAGFEEIEANCFPGLDGNLHYVAISPRHLEACATRTCQVLIEGEYNGILKPGVHYIELKRDFSNLDEVLKWIEQDHLREEMTERAYRDIVQSGLYSYERFVSAVLDEALSTAPKTRTGLFDRIVSQWNWVVHLIHPYRIRAVRNIRKQRNKLKQVITNMRKGGKDSCGGTF
jgi:hypothetical protein